MSTMQVRGFFNLYKPSLPCQMRFIEYVNDSSITLTDVENCIAREPNFRGWFTDWVEIHPNYESIKCPETRIQK